MRINFPGTLLFGTTLFMISASSVAASAADPIEELKGCARTEDKAVRMACYEALGARVLGEESDSVMSPPDVEPAVSEPVVAASAVAEVAVVESVVAEAAPPPPEPNRLPDDLGVEKKKEEKKPAEKKSFRGHVRSCGQTSDDRWYFVFESGQVWKQSSNGIYRFKECDFDVTITKDFFSYKMKIDGGKTLRVKRER